MQVRICVCSAFTAVLCGRDSQYFTICISCILHISLRLLALILCSNCSNTFNKVLTTIGGHMLNYFLKLGGSLELAQHPPRIIKAFHAPP